MKLDRFVTILGPTASGKTQLSLHLAQKFNGEVVCADSLTIYTGMDIGTAKPSTAEQKKVRHHLLDIVSPNTKFSVARYKELAVAAIADIGARSKVAFLVGGSGMYIDAVLFDYQFRSQKSNDDLGLDELTLDELTRRAEHKYPRETTVLQSGNRRRIEQLLKLGPANSGDRDEQKVDSLVLGIASEELTLKQNIADRTKTMLNKGFVREVEGLIKLYGLECPALQTTGYKQVSEMLSGSLVEDELEQSINAATWQQARKQLTWFRRNKNIIWISSPSEAERLISDYLSR